MFCPKCGTQNPESGKFCRSCGTDLGDVSVVISGGIPAHLSDAGAAQIHHEAKRRNDPNEVFGDGVKAIISGLGFLIVSMALLITNVAGGHAWWWAMLFPAFSFLAKGISDYLKYKKMVGLPGGGNSAVLANSLPSGSKRRELSSTETPYIAAESRYKTGDLVPPSVTDGTTRQLEINTEGETMTLPKKD